MACDMPVQTVGCSLVRGHNFVLACSPANTFKRPCHPFHPLRHRLDTFLVEVKIYRISERPRELPTFYTKFWRTASGRSKVHKLGSFVDLAPRRLVLGPCKMGYVRDARGIELQCRVRSFPRSHMFGFYSGSLLIADDLDSLSRSCPSAS